MGKKNPVVQLNELYTQFMAGDIDRRTLSGPCRNAWSVGNGAFHVRQGSSGVCSGRFSRGGRCCQADSSR